MSQNQPKPLVNRSHYAQQLVATSQNSTAQNYLDLTVLMGEIPTDLPEIQAPDLVCIRYKGAAMFRYSLKDACEAVLLFKKALTGKKPGNGQVHEDEMLETSLDEV